MGEGPGISAERAGTVFEIEPVGVVIPLEQPTPATGNSIPSNSKPSVRFIMWCLFSDDNKGVPSYFQNRTSQSGG
jgi:hypothetical protein